MLTDDIIIVKNTTAIGVAKMRQREPSLLSQGGREMKKITSLKKGIMILKRLSEKPYEMSAIELSNDLGINRSTVHRILKHLIEENLIEQNIENKKYRLGYITHKIGKGYVESREYLEID